MVTNYTINIEYYIFWAFQNNKNGGSISFWSIVTKSNLLITKT